MPLEISDVLAIHQLYANYSFASDHGDGAAYAACFTSDGVFEMPGRRVEGADALAASSTNASDGAPAMRHMLSNIVVDGEGDQARGKAYATLLRTQAAPVAILMTGEYSDHLVRVDGSWRFSQRRFTPDAAPS